MSAPDMFVLGGRKDGDERVITLFREWIDVCGKADTEDSDEGREPFLQRRDQIEDQIALLRGGPVALAVKAYFLARQQHDGGDWCGSIAAFRIDDPSDLLIEVLRDAGNIVPEIAELAAALIHEDAAFIAAEIEVRWCRDMLKEAEVRTYLGGRRGREAPRANAGPHCLLPTQDRPRPGDQSPP